MDVMTLTTRSSTPRLDRALAGRTHGRRTVLQLTHDHPVTRRMIDAGELAEAEAATHPQRAIVVRALDAEARDPPDVRAQDARAGDRYLLA